jgi:hypothetical protein
LRSVIINKEKATVFKGPHLAPIGPYETLKDVWDKKEELSKETFDSLYQTIYEKELWSTGEYNDILCPVVRYFPFFCVVEMKYIEPIMSRERSEQIGEEDSIAFLTKIVLERGGTEAEISTFVHRVFNLCQNTDLAIEDILYNLSNIGYSKELGIRIIDYGFSKELEETYFV